MRQLVKLENDADGCSSRDHRRRSDRGPRLSCPPRAPSRDGSLRTLEQMV